MPTDRTSPGRGLAQTVLQTVPLTAAAVVLLDTATDFFPDEPLTGVLTPVRLTLLLGLVALLAAPGELFADKPFARRLGLLRTRLDLPVALLVLAAAATTYHGGHSTAPLRSLLTSLACFYLVVGVRRSRPESWRAVGTLALVATGAAGAAAFSQFTNDTPTGFCRTGLFTDVSCESGAAGTLIRATGTFANPNLLAAYLVLLLPFVLLAAVATDEATARTVVIALGLLGYGAVLTTFSRAGYVAAAAGLLVLGAAYWRTPKSQSSGPPRRGLALGLGVFAVLAVAGALAVLSRAGSSLGVRGEAWEAAVRLGTENPLGVGLGRAGTTVSAAVPSPRTFVHSHNLWLNWLAEAGLLGLLAILSVTGVALYSALRAARAKSAIGIVGLAGLTGFLLMCMLDHPANLERVDLLFWLALGFVMAEAPASWRRSATEPPRIAPPRHGPRHGRTARTPGGIPGSAPGSTPSSTPSSSAAPLPGPVGAAPMSAAPVSAAPGDRPPAPYSGS
ncbi:O-antigen ligase family protein [Streptomyces sp. NA04227]|uniref:O-antigen ligase family protein n=1 Tax=Streptomyces sp. NA04227 TaxID=2742136 RepID=UPI001592A185|nr:O-antigen ligase family protein [Streptomyces sp. NA04227]QKW07646.1 O-antigen ligase family protein [Streptomyces sp. NA04227]